MEQTESEKEVGHEIQVRVFGEKIETEVGVAFCLQGFLCSRLSFHPFLFLLS